MRALLGLLTAILLAACGGPPYEGRWQRVDDTHVLEITGNEFEFDSPDPDGPFGDCRESGTVAEGANSRVRFTYDISTCSTDRRDTQRIATYAVSGRSLTLDFEDGARETFEALSTGELPRPHGGMPSGGGETDHIGSWDAESIDGMSTFETGVVLSMTSTVSTFTEDWISEGCIIEGTQMVTATRMERSVTRSTCSFVVDGADLSGGYNVTGEPGDRRLTFTGDDGSRIIYTGF